MLRKDDLENTILINSTFQELIDKYGEENARYVWETLHPEIENDRYIYIEIEEFAHLGYLDRIKEKAEEEGKQIEKISGSIRIIRDLISGKWDDDDFLIVQPGKEIKAKYDLDQIIFTD